MSIKIKEFIKTHRKRIKEMYKDLHSDGPEMSEYDLGFDEGYINGSIYLINQLKKINKNNNKKNNIKKQKKDWSIKIIKTKAKYSTLLYEIEFQDKNGRSSLARTNSLEKAMKLQKKFRLDKNNGYLLKPFKSAYK